MALVDAFRPVSVDGHLAFNVIPQAAAILRAEGRRFTEWNPSKDRCVLEAGTLVEVVSDDRVVVHQRT